MWPFGINDLANTLKNAFHKDLSLKSIPHIPEISHTTTATSRIDLKTVFDPNPSTDYTDTNKIH